SLSSRIFPIHFNREALKSGLIENKNCICHKTTRGLSNKL
ncbi:MAG: hypothetical protein ACI9DM_000650, partial [Cyclobacteriaceae bacterium]